MSEISFLAIPNIAGMRLWWYIQVFGSVIFFWICLFFVLYFWSKYRKGKKLSHQLEHFDHRAQDIQRELVLQKIHKSSGKNLCVLFVDYLERFVTNKSYANLSELLVLHWFTHKEAKEIAEVLYTDKELPKHIEYKITAYFTS